MWTHCFGPSFSGGEETSLKRDDLLFESDFEEECTDISVGLWTL